MRDGGGGWRERGRERGENNRGYSASWRGEGLSTNDTKTGSHLEKYRWALPKNINFCAEKNYNQAHL